MNRFQIKIFSILVVAISVKAGATSPQGTAASPQVPPSSGSPQGTANPSQGLASPPQIPNGEAAPSIDMGSAVEESPKMKATPLKTFVDKKNKFQLAYPVGWKVVKPDSKKGPSPSLVSFSKPDKTIMVTILFAKNETKLSAPDFLKQMDESRRMENKVAAEKRTMTAEQLKNSSATEGAVGTYEFPGKEVVLQKASAYKGPKGVFVVTGTYQKSRESADGPQVTTVLDSFQLK